MGSISKLKTKTKNSSPTLLQWPLRSLQEVAGTTAISKKQLPKLRSLTTEERILKSSQGSDAQLRLHPAWQMALVCVLEASSLAVPNIHPHKKVQVKSSLSTDPILWPVLEGNGKTEFTWTFRYRLVFWTGTFLELSTNTASNLLLIKCECQELGQKVEFKLSEV